MAEITAALVKELRDKTGAGMMDCKKALSETAGDLEGAVDWLRKKGLASAAKKASRVAAEGVVAVVVEGARGALVEVNCETDFVARNEQFQAFAGAVARLALGIGGDLAALKAARMANGKTVDEATTELVASIGENIAVRRTAALSVAKGVVASYVHMPVVPGLGRIGVLVALESAAAAEPLQALGKQLAMHVAAAKPESVAVADLDPASVERERRLLTDQAKESGKPEAVIAKMVEGRLRKFYQDVVLTEQVFVVDGESRVGQVIEKAGKDHGQPVKVAAFARFAVGEGIEKGESDFAAEVAQLSH
ncbi:MAG: elongation factor Ts [Alphaproteobacteria bacterium]|nr:elongation factor Ts [Alphaproteobacteria bacterium]